MICGGEALSRELARNLVSRCLEVWNCYGPTETTIWSVTKKMDPKDIEGEGYSPIGRPIDNTQLYVLNSKLVPVPVGVAGELFIGGVGLSPGYLHLPEMTAEKLRRDLSPIINRAAYGIDPVVITRRGIKIAALISIDDLMLLEKARWQRQQTLEREPWQ